MQHKSLLLVLSYKLQCEHTYNRIRVHYNVTHQCLCCTLQCRCHLLHQVSCSGRSHPLHLLCGSYVPPYYLCLCRNPSSCLEGELGFHWGRTSSWNYKNCCNKSLGEFCRTVLYPLHQCPSGSQDCCSDMFCFRVRTTDFFHLGRIRYECANVMILCIGNMFKHNAQWLRGNFSLCACDWWVHPFLWS